MYETLKLIHVDFRVQTTGEHLRDTTKGSGVTAIVRRGKIDDNILPNKTDVLARTNILFSNNHEKLLPSEYYRQSRKWYAAFSTMKSEWNPDQTALIQRFKINFDVVPPSGWP